MVWEMAVLTKFFLHNVYRDNTMEFKNVFVNCNVVPADDYSYIKITGRVANRGGYKSALLIAGNPIDKTASYSATGLPFPCADIAFEGTKNVYNIDSSGNIDAVFTYPNSYYTVADKKKIVSSIFFILEYHDENKEFIRFELKDLYPLRSLVNRENRIGPEFYSAKYDMLPIDTAEILMREYAKHKVLHDIA